MQTDARQSNYQSDSPEAENFTISKVAHLTGINAKAIRYYESIGLLPSPPRAANQYRSYSIADVNRLNLLRRIRLLGVPLSAAKSLLIGATDARCIDVQQELLVLVRERLKVIDQEIAELQQLRAEVEIYQLDLTNCQPNEQEPFRICNDMSCIAVLSITN